MATEETRLANRWAGLNREKLGHVNMRQPERWASVLGGAALAALALRGGRRSRGLAGLAALAGLPLLLRGATGHCPVYQKLGIDKSEGSTSGKGTALASQRVEEEPSTELAAVPTF